MSLVEYHDPDGLFPLVENELRARLPLENLHWKSTKRPLRSIAKLQVNFVKDDQAPVASRSEPNSGANEARERPASNDAGRRHQIPGLRQTPYLKLYLLQCDDNEYYKTVSRSRLREWIKANTPASHTKSDNHDAFEWLIVHVVQLNTKLVRQSSAGQGSFEESSVPKDKSLTSSKSPSKVASALLEKIRSDFNTTGKSSPDRVSQVIVSKETEGVAAANTRPSSSSSTQNALAKEHESGWNDLVEKLKSLILTSFSLRVAQYEDDIHDKEAQRALPGWNFSTFFILKEGLAIAFQSVGLHEDALSIYDESSVGLETAVRDVNLNGKSTQSTSFAPFTHEIRDYGLSLNESRKSTVQRPAHIFQSPLDVKRKDYRSLIVSSSISVFDFACYIFARQALIILRSTTIAQPMQHPSELSNTAVRADGKEDGRHDQETISRLTDLCSRTAKFLSSTGRILRADLYSGLNTSESLTSDLSSVINSVISEWSFSVAQQILDNTNTPALPRLPESPETRRNKLTEVKSLEHAGHVNLASERAGLLTMQRTALYQEALKHEWIISPTELLKATLAQEHPHEADTEASEDIKNSRSKESGDKGQQVNDNHSTSVFGDCMRSKENFKRGYETLIYASIWLNTLASRKQTADKLLLDLAVSKLDEQDFASAASYFSSLNHGVAERGYTKVEPIFTFLYSACLRRLNRRDEYMRVLTSLLQTFADITRSQHIATSRRNIPSPNQNSLSAYSLLPSRQQLFSELVESSRDLTHSFSIEGDMLIEVSRVDHHITLFPDRDGFQMSMVACQFLADSVTFESIDFQLVSKTGSHEQVVHLRNDGPVTMGQGSQTIDLQTSVSTYGRFLVQSVTFSSGKVALSCNFQAPTPPVTSLDLSTVPPAQNQVPKFSPVICYPRADALDAKLSRPRKLHAGRRKAIEITISTGSNDVLSGTITVKPKSAGLRLYTSEFTLVSDAKPEISETDHPGTLGFGSLSSQHEIAINIPVDIEHNVQFISARLEIIYKTSSGTSTFITTGDVKINHPLDVNVQDVFKQNCIVSKVLLQPVDDVPVRVFDAKLHENTDYDVQPALKCFRPLLTYPNKPACATYRIQNRRQDPTNDKPADPLMLEIEYSNTKDELLRLTKESFCQQLSSSPFRKHERLLWPAVEDSIQHGLSSSKLEQFGVSDLTELPKFSQSDWEQISWSLPTNEVAEVERWLQQWYADHQTFTLGEDKSVRDSILAKRRALLVDFTVPNLRYVYSSRLFLRDLGTPTPTATSITHVGKALFATIETQYTKQWASKSSGDQTGAGNVESFYLEIQGDPNTWLIGGQRKIHFSAEPGQKLTFSTVLIPLRPGNALLPSVDIKKTQSDMTHTCETNCLSKSEVVLIVEDMEDTTLALSIDENSSRGATLLESKARSSG